MPRLIVMSPRSATRQVSLLAARTTVGRDNANALVIDSTRVSRRHAELIKDGLNVWVRDLGSSNGTFVNDERIECARLQHGDVVVIGDCKLRFLARAAAKDFATVALDLASVMGDANGLRRPTARPGALAGWR